MQPCDCKLHVSEAGWVQRNFQQLESWLSKKVEDPHASLHAQFVLHCQQVYLGPMFVQRNDRQFKFHKNEHHHKGNCTWNQNAHKLLLLIFFPLLTLTTAWFIAMRSTHGSLAKAVASNCDCSKNFMVAKQLRHACQVVTQKYICKHYTYIHIYIMQIVKTWHEQHQAQSFWNCQSQTQWQKQRGHQPCQHLSPTKGKQWQTHTYTKLHLHSCMLDKSSSLAHNTHVHASFSNHRLSKGQASEIQANMFNWQYAQIAIYSMQRKTN